MHRLSTECGCVAVQQYRPDLAAAMSRDPTILSQLLLRPQIIENSVANKDCHTVTPTVIYNLLKNIIK